MIFFLITLDHIPTDDELDVISFSRTPAIISVNDSEDIIFYGCSYLGWRCIIFNRGDEEFKNLKFPCKDQSPILVTSDDRDRSAAGQFSVFGLPLAYIALFSKLNKKEAHKCFYIRDPDGCSVYELLDRCCESHLTHAARLKQSNILHSISDRIGKAIPRLAEPYASASFYGKELEIIVNIISSSKLSLAAKSNKKIQQRYFPNGTLSLLWLTADKIARQNEHFEIDNLPDDPKKIIAAASLINKR
jgi:hypothetical protein